MTYLKLMAFMTLILDNAELARCYCGDIDDGNGSPCTNRYMSHYILHIPIDIHSYHRCD